MQTERLRLVVVEGHLGAGAGRNGDLLLVVVLMVVVVVLIVAVELVQLMVVVVVLVLLLVARRLGSHISGVTLIRRQARHVAVLLL